MALLLTKDRRLEMQGFSYTSKSGIKEIDNWLRVTPAVSTVWILLSTVAASPRILVVVHDYMGNGSCESAASF
ncbi:MAG: hypothetical protein ACQEST_12370 [Bacteroidota bacterium]